MDAEEFVKKVKEVFGIAKEDAKKLYNQGFNSISKLKDADLVDLVPVLGFRGARLARQRIVGAMRKKGAEIEEIVKAEMKKSARVIKKSASMEDTLRRMREVGDRFIGKIRGIVKKRG